MKTQVKLRRGSFRIHVVERDRRVRNVSHRSVAALEIELPCSVSVGVVCSFLGEVRVRIGHFSLLERATSPELFHTVHGGGFLDPQRLFVA